MTVIFLGAGDYNRGRKQAKSLVSQNTFERETEETNVRTAQVAITAVRKTARETRCSEREGSVRIAQRGL